MKFKQGVAAAAVLAVGITASLGAIQLRAAQDPLLGYCPPRAGSSCALAVQMYLRFARPRDDELVSVFNTIVARLGDGRHSRRAYNDTLQALSMLANNIHNPGLKSMAESLITAIADSIPPPRSDSGDATNKSALDGFGQGGNSGLAGGVNGGSSGSSGSSGDQSSSGSSGQSSSGASGSSGNSVSSGSSGSSGSSSGSSGQSSSGAGSDNGSDSSSSSGASGSSGDQSSSGSSGQSSSGSSGQSSSGASGSSGNSVSSGSSGSSGSSSGSSGQSSSGTGSDNESDPPQPEG